MCQPNWSKCRAWNIHRIFLYPAEYRAVGLEGQWLDTLHSPAIVVSATDDNLSVQIRTSKVRSLSNHIRSIVPRFAVKILKIETELACNLTSVDFNRSTPLKPPKAQRRPWLTTVTTPDRGDNIGVTFIHVSDEGFDSGSQIAFLNF